MGGGAPKHMHPDKHPGMHRQAELGNPLFPGSIIIIATNEMPVSCAAYVAKRSTIIVICFS